MVNWMRAWIVAALFIAWLIAELAAAFVPALRTRTLTETVVTYVPAWITVPAALLLAVWLPWHFVTNYRRRKAMVSAPLSAASEVAMLSKLAQYNKLWVAVATAVLQAVQAEIPMSTTWHGWVTVALAGLGAAGVFAVPNKQPADPSAAPKAS